MSRPSATEYGSFYQTYINYTSGKDYPILVQQYHDRITESWAAIPAERAKLCICRRQMDYQTNVTTCN